MKRHSYIRRQELNRAAAALEPKFLKDMSRQGMRKTRQFGRSILVAGQQAGPTSLLIELS